MVIFIMIIFIYQSDLRFFFDQCGFNVDLNGDLIGFKMGFNDDILDYVMGIWDFVGMSWDLWYGLV